MNKDNWFGYQKNTIERCTDFSPVVDVVGAGVVALLVVGTCVEVGCSVTTAKYNEV